MLERLRAARPKNTGAVAPSDDAGPGSSYPGPPPATSARTSPAGTKPGAPPAPKPAGKKSTGSTTAAVRVTASRAAAGGSSVIRHIGSWDPDLVRRIVVTVVTIGAVLGTAEVAGAFGGPDLREASLGTFDPAATLVSPAAPAAYAWLLIGVSLIGYTIHQWLPAHQRSPRHRGLGWAVVVALLVTLGWAVAVQRGMPALSLVLIFLLLAMLLASLRWLNHYPAQTRPEGLLVDIPLGLFLGWTGVTATVHTAAVLTTLGVDWLEFGAQRWALIGVILLTLAAMAVCMTDRGRIAVALAVVWGLVLIVPERLLGDPQSIPVAFAAGLGAFLLIISAGSRRHRVDHAYRRELRARQMATVPPIDFFDDGEPATARQ